MASSFSEAAKNIASEPTTVLRMDALCLINEYDILASDTQLDPKTKEARLNALDECLFDNFQAQENTKQLHLRPDEYKAKCKDVYGPHRKIMFPPSGDRARKYVESQVKRLSSRDSLCSWY